MAYDSKTYGQSPFGSPKTSDDQKAGGAKTSAKASSKASEAKPLPVAPLVDDGLDQGPAATGLASKFPAVPVAEPKAPAGKITSDSGRGDRKSRTNNKAASKPTSKTTKRKSKKTKAAEAAEAEAEAVEAAVAKRFFEEDRKAYLSLLYKIGISGLVWAVLRLLRHELSEDTVAVINTLIDPVMIATVTLIGILALTFWMRSLLKDLSLHTQKLYADAELTEGKDYRPTLEIVGDSLEYNPKLRKNLASFYDVASMLICGLISYLVTFALFPTD